MTWFEQTRNQVPFGLSKPNMNDFWSVVVFYVPSTAGSFRDGSPFTIPCKGCEAQFLHRSHRESNPWPLRGSPITLPLRHTSSVYIQDLHTIQWTYQDKIISVRYDSRIHCIKRRNSFSPHRPQPCFLFMPRLQWSGPCRVGLVVSLSASHTVDHEFASRPGHTKDHHKNGTSCLPAWHAMR